jgi:magnesium chelatase family protein
MSGNVQSIIMLGSTGLIVDIECHLSNNLPNIVIVGFVSKSVDEAKDRLRGAFATSRITLPRKRITVNLAPADIPKADSGFDLAIAVSIMQAAEQLAARPPVQEVFIGELGLDGQTRAVRGIIGKVLAGRAKGITDFYIPVGNVAQAQLVPNVTIIPVTSLHELYQHLTDTVHITALRTGSNGLAPSAIVNVTNPERISLDDIVGQAVAKRALEIAAAGSHNVFFSGPPGTGKSMLAKAFPGLLPALTREEILEITHLHSLASHDYEQIITRRPFRAPHHSASHIAVIGGGATLRPGEISLSHRGILFFDELPEFNRQTLEALRQPLEDRVISVARAKDTAEFPANFILIATANPCPCGYYGTSGICRCMPAQILKYRQRLSGPIIDRIDLFSEVSEVKHAKLLSAKSSVNQHELARQRIVKARAMQAKRYDSFSKYNADMTNGDIMQLGKLEPAAKTLLDTAAERLNISARAYMRTIKVARTIADLEASAAISVAHISEALAYRRPVHTD